MLKMTIEFLIEASESDVPLLVSNRTGGSQKDGAAESCEIDIIIMQHPQLFRDSRKAMLGWMNNALIRGLENPDWSIS
jgi:hypothetical protein